METNAQTQLFVELTADESATVNGAHRYYYAPRYYSPCRYGYGGYSGGYYGGGNGGGYGNGGSVTQTTNVNVVIED